MKLYSIYILNKAGGLIYQNNLDPSLNRLTANDYLVLAGTLHGVHAIAAKLTPTIVGKDSTSTTSGTDPTANNALLLSTGKVQNSNTNKTGLGSIETDLFNLYVFQSLTGIKFILITSPNPILQKQHEQASETFRHLYVLYSDYVMKDPFYSLDMPIKSQLFDLKVGELAALV
ncbi:Sybindin-like protein [Suhomyces tanzawaensis NRRL Y-17324]|uniref:Trafficking protein particle complex subunit n=1 Tax=Suhomyces tanzawaensis NRRL Y-17324 TaxID=984487 RepID=A0A1E4SJ12_9ASCO|nr:Sybindin-like protein [Suhomyces tanzawaensis NRRL Y-17324]ODV79491.1 Sybindin-like protein [Suhomyces tanzawaensis NRRL Y-17324]